MVLCDRLETAQAERKKRRNRLAAASLNRLNRPDDEARAFRPRPFPPLPPGAFHVRPDQVPALRQTILGLGVSGRLVRQDPNDEPGRNCSSGYRWRRCGSARPGRLRKRAVRPVANDDMPFGIPATWGWARIGDCSLLAGYGTSVKSDNVESGVPVLKMGDIQGRQVLLEGKRRSLETLKIFRGCS